MHDPNPTPAPRSIEPILPRMIVDREHHAVPERSRLTHPCHDAHASRPIPWGPGTVLSLVKASPTRTSNPSRTTNTNPIPWTTPTNQRKFTKSTTTRTTTATTSVSPISKPPIQDPSLPSSPPHKSNMTFMKLRISRSSRRWWSRRLRARVGRRLSIRGFLGWEWGWGWSASLGRHGSGRG